MKDWKLETLRRIDKISAQLCVDGATKTVANPLEQARQYTMTVVNKLAEDPQLRQAEGPYKGKLCFNISLAARLRSFIAERGLEGRVNVHHFHAWCGEQLRRELGRSFSLGKCGFICVSGPRAMAWAGMGCPLGREDEALPVHHENR